MAFALREAVGDQLLGAVEIDDADVVSFMHENFAIDAL
jgi:hypothetical protein